MDRQLVCAFHDPKKEALELVAIGQSGRCIPRNVLALENILQKPGVVKQASALTQQKVAKDSVSKRGPLRTAP